MLTLHYTTRRGLCLAIDASAMGAKLTVQQKDIIHNMFMKIDANKDGRLSVREVAVRVAAARPPLTERSRIASTSPTTRRMIL